MVFCEDGVKHVLEGQVLVSFQPFSSCLYYLRLGGDNVPDNALKGGKQLAEFLIGKISLEFHDYGVRDKDLGPFLFASFQELESQFTQRNHVIPPVLKVVPPDAGIQVKPFCHAKNGGQTV